MQSTTHWPTVGSTSRRADVPSPSSSRASTPDIPRTPNQPIPDPLAEPEPPYVCLDCTFETNCRTHIFRFLDLPTELRINVYQKGLLRQQPINLASKLLPVFEKIDIAPRHIGSAMMLTPTRRGRYDVAVPEIDPRGGHDTNKEKNRRMWRTRKEPLPVKIFLVSKQIYQEALPVLYRENAFNLDLEFSLLTLTSLRQRTRSLIKHAILTMHDPSRQYHTGFNHFFVNGLRYCFGLQKLDILLADNIMPMLCLYDLKAHVLRWLPKSCVVEVKGDHMEDEVLEIVDEHNMLAKTLDLVSCSTSIPLLAYMMVSTYAGSSGSA